MEFNENDDEILPEARVFFEVRAPNIFQSKLQAMKELMNKAPEELEELEEEEGFGKQKKPRGKKPKREKPSDKVKEVKPKRTRKKKMAEKNREHSLEMRNGREGTPILESDDDLPPRRRRREATPEDDWYASPVKSRGGRRRKALVDKEGGSDGSDELNSSINLPAASKRKIKELQLNTSRLQRRIDLENKRIFSALDAAKVSSGTSEDVDFELNIPLKIRFMSDISKMTVKLGDSFASIYDKVADMHKFQASEILLCVRDQTIKHTDTPLSLNLKYFEIIDCLPFKLSDDQEENVSKSFVLKMQSNDTRKKVDVYGSQLEKFEGFMKRYSEIRNIPLDKLSFEFDGEKIDGFETPEELDIESGSCIDVNVSKENSVPATHINEDIEVTAEIISPSNGIEIFELD